MSGNNFIAHAVLYYLDEAGISAASGNTFVVNWTTVPQVPAYGAASYANVDQSSPIGDFNTAAVDGATPNPITATINVVADGYSVAVAQCGNAGVYSWNNGWTIGFDASPSSSSNSVADNAETTTGTSTASATHDNPNRQVLIAAALTPRAYCGRSGFGSHRTSKRR